MILAKTGGNVTVLAEMLKQQGSTDPMGEAGALVAESANGGGGDTRAVKLMCDIAAFDGVALELIDGKLTLEGRDGSAFGFFSIPRPLGYSTAVPRSLSRATSGLWHGLAHTLHASYGGGDHSSGAHMRSGP